MMNGATLLWYFHAVQPFGKAFDYILLKKSFCSNPTMIALHRDWTSSQMGQHHRGDHLVVVGQLALGYTIRRKHNLVRVGDHTIHFTLLGSPASSAAATPTHTQVARGQASSPAIPKSHQRKARGLPRRAAEPQTI